MFYVQSLSPILNVNAFGGRSREAAAGEVEAVVVPISV